MVRGSISMVRGSISIVTGSTSVVRGSITKVRASTSDLQCNMVIAFSANPSLLELDTHCSSLTIVESCSSSIL